VPAGVLPAATEAAGVLPAATLAVFTFPVEPLRDANRAFLAAARLLIKDFFFTLIVCSGQNLFLTFPS
jgi:hypothetical protein